MGNKTDGNIVDRRFWFAFSINNRIFGLSSFAPYPYPFMDMHGNINQT